MAVRFPNVYPINVIASTRLKLFRPVNDLSITPSGAATLRVNIQEMLTKVGWKQQNTEEFISTKYYRKNGTPFLYIDPYDDRLVLSMRQEREMLIFKLRPVVNKGFDHSREFNLRISPDMKVMVDPFSLHIVAANATLGFERSLSACALHLPEVLRLDPKGSLGTGDYAHVSFLITNSNFLLEGYWNTVGTYASCGSFRYQSAQFFSAKTGGGNLDTWAPYLSPSAIKTKMETLIGPAIAAWGNTENDRILGRGFLWNLCYIVGGAFPETTAIQTKNGRVILPLNLNPNSSNRGAQLCWVVT